MTSLEKVRKGSHHPEARIMAFCRRVHGRVADNENDLRLSEAQRYAGMLQVLKCDPAILLAKIIDMCIKGQSKWHVELPVLHRMIVDLHHMVSPSPDYRSRKLDAQDNQFELDFQWSGEGGERVAVLEAAE
jgi:hypothetical protein